MIKILLNPLAVFYSIWLFVLLLYFFFPVSYFMVDFSFSSWCVVTLSFLGFIFGYFSSSLHAPIKSSLVNERHLLNKSRLLFCIWFLILLALFIVLFNILTQGLPPILSENMSSYVTYGRFKGFLYADIALLFLLTFYLRTYFKWLIRFFSIVILVSYLARGVLMLTFIQAIFMYFFMKLNAIHVVKFRSNVGQFLPVIFLVVFIILGLSFLSELRGQSDLYFKEVMGIKDEYRSYSFVFLWFVSYVTLPTSNLFYIIDHWTTFTYGYHLYNSSVPAFFSVESKEAASTYLNGLPNKYSNVATYLGWPVIDFFWAGIFFMNYLIGFVSLIIYKLKGSRYFLIKCIWLSSIALLFFNNFFFYFPVIAENIMALLIIIYVYPLRRRNI